MFLTHRFAAHLDAVLPSQSSFWRACHPFSSKSKCEATDLKSAGQHFNPDVKKHGLENPDGHHVGDMQNFYVDGRGISNAKLLDNDFTLGDGTHSLLSNGGTAIVIHAKADDMKTDPSGNSGDRIACGVVAK